MVVMMRNRIDPKRLRMMTAEDVLAWQMEQGIYFVDADYGVCPYKTTISGDTAQIQFGYEETTRSSGGYLRWSPQRWARATGCFGPCIKAEARSD
jgi:hypothetical protein